MLSARAIAIQGFGYGALLTAVQGLLPIAEIVHGGGGGGFPRRATHIQVRSRRRDEDELFLIILAALHVLNNQ